MTAQMRTMVAVARYLPAALPWRPLAGACLLGLLPLVLAHADATGVLGQTSRLPAVAQVAFLLTACGVAFLADGTAEPLVTSLPVSERAVALLRLAAALPLVAATAGIQLALAVSLRTADEPAFPWPAFAAQTVGWWAVAAGAGALVSRTRWANLGGAVAAPVAIAVLAVLAVSPFGLTPTDLVRPPAGGWDGLGLRWLAVAAVASVVAYHGLRDRWYRGVTVGRGTTTP